MRRETKNHKKFFEFHGTFPQIFCLNIRKTKKKQLFGGFIK